MPSNEHPTCAFDTPTVFEDRLIHIGGTCFSIVSNPRFREYHALVIPIRHVEHRHDLHENEEAEYSQEINRLTRIVSALGRGYQTLVKFQPDQPENGVKMNHLHTHIYPRSANDPLIATPEPNTFDGMATPTPEQIKRSVDFYKQ